MAEMLIPESPTLERLREVAAGCKACHLWERGTQTVFGEGARDAEVMLVGEQPGDQEDRAGQPFVGPAGRAARRGARGGRDRPLAGVRHQRRQALQVGGARQAAHPREAELDGDRGVQAWLEAELAVVEPRVLVCLGATAAQALLGKQFRVTKQRGELVESPLAPNVVATIHPSAILRQRDEESRREEMAAFVDDLRVVAKLLG